MIPQFLHLSDEIQMRYWCTCLHCSPGVPSKVTLFVLYLRNLFLIQGHKDLLLYFLVEILNSRFYFYSIIHFKLIFFVMVWSMNWGSIFFVYGLHMAQFFLVIISVQHHLLKSFSTELPLQFGQKSVDHIFIGLFLDFLLFSINLYIFHQNHTWLL